MPASVDRKLRIPLRYIDGQWEVEFGGTVPVEDGQEAELLVPEAAIVDRDFLDQMKKRMVLPVLPKGARLRAYLATKEFEGISEEQQKHLLEWQNWYQEISPLAIDGWSSGPLSFFELTLGPATERQMRDQELREGGLWLEIKGRRATGLISSTFELPPCVSTTPASSLNHAFTLLSEVYEPWRISHTGNAYERFLYQEQDGNWYPLWLLREASVAKSEQAIAKALWDKMLKRMAPILSEKED